MSGPSADAPGSRCADDTAWADEPTVEPDHFERLAGDRALEERLRGAGFAGPEYDYFENEVAKYGYAVIRAWIRRGEIAERCRARRVRGAPDLDLSLLDDDAVTQIAGETVATALVAFRDRVLVPGAWDPAKGASLRTFFVGQCLFRYPNAARRWIKDNPVREEEPFDEFTAAGLAVAGSSVEKQVLDAIAAERALAALGDDARRLAVQMYAQGYSHREIGQVLERTPKAIERMLAKIRSVSEEEAG